MRLVSLNVERSKHLERILPFLEKVKPDVVCVQELHESDTGLFEAVVGTCVSDAPNCWHIADEPGKGPQIMGTAIFTRHKNIPLETHYYAGTRSHALTSNEKVYVEDHALVGCDIICESDVFRVLTTHFTWSAGGKATDLQRRNMSKLLRALGGQGEFIFAADLNAPRGGEIFNELASRYEDNIPPEYKTSLDVDFRPLERRHELLDKMVDGLFTTRRFKASNVELVFGLSDHAAIVADISTA